MNITDQRNKLINKSIRKIETELNFIKGLQANKEFCIWHKLNKYNDYKIECLQDLKSFKENIEHFNYCFNCGRKIKLKK